MKTPTERVKKALDHLREGLLPFVQRELRAKIGAKWEDDARGRLGLSTARDGSVRWDTQAVVKAIGQEYWNDVFRTSLQQIDRNYAMELRDVRNKLAHDEPFSNDDTYRALDTAQRLLESVHARSQAEEVGKLKGELQQSVLAEVKTVDAKNPLVIEMAVKAGLKPWREVVTPHRDVASGRYMQAEFAADLSQVHSNEGSDEYRDPVEFFRRTYLTVGLKDLLVGALQRLSGGGGDPVVELQTNFDGEHSLPLELDRLAPNLGKVSACRRMTRTLYMGTAPGATHKNPGIDDRRVRLGCVQPGAGGVKEDVVRTVQENTRTLKFQNATFERE